MGKNENNGNNKKKPYRKGTSHGIDIVGEVFMGLAICSFIGTFLMPDWEAVQDQESKDKKIETRRRDDRYERK